MCQKPQSNTTVKQSKPSDQNDAEESKVQKTIKMVESKHEHKRNTDYDLLIFLLPALCYKLTPVIPLYIIGISRMIATHTLLTMHYLFFDKDNYDNKLTQKQLTRERDDYLVGTVLHMYAQVVLQIIFPGMFFTDDSFIRSCAINTFLSHVFVVEPLYYFAHRWLHIPEQMKAMHGFHHLSINTLPSTSLVQNFTEHFVYIATFGPAFLLPFFLGGQQHWKVIMGYLIAFDCINAFGHMNIKLRNPIFTHKFSPVRYLFYTPEFHLGHHAYFRANYGLFMPFWDLALGTYRDYKIKDNNRKPAKQQDFVFIGHNGGLGHLLTCPEVSVYNVYNKWKQYLPLQLEFLICDAICHVARLFVKSYTVSRYLINGEKIGRIICIARGPIDFILAKRHKAVNDDIIGLIKDQYQKCGTRKFGLGNLTKMKQLNDGGVEIARRVKEDAFLKDKNIRIWTGDTMTAASVYNQIAEIPGINEIFYIGANGKIGNVVCEMLSKKLPHVKVRVFSSYHGMDLPNVTYTQDLTEMLKYKVIVSGKIIPSHKFDKVSKTASAENLECKTRFILDYTVPFIPIRLKAFPEIQHIPIGLLQVTGKTFLRGHFDICMSHDENHIYPCHAGCIIATSEDRETDEVGDIDIVEMERMWKKGLNYGFQNRIIDYQ